MERGTRTRFWFARGEVDTRPALHRRRARCPARCRNRHGETNTRENILAGWIQKSRDDADHLPKAINQRAARIAGVDGGVELNKVLQGEIAARQLVGALET